MLKQAFCLPFVLLDRRHQDTTFTKNFISQNECYICCWWAWLGVKTWFWKKIHQKMDNFRKIFRKNILHKCLCALKLMFEHQNIFAKHFSAMSPNFETLSDFCVLLWEIWDFGFPTFLCLFWYFYAFSHRYIFVCISVTFLVGNTYIRRHTRQTIGV